MMPQRTSASMLARLAYPTTQDPASRAPIRHGADFIDANDQRTNMLTGRRGAPLELPALDRDMEDAIWAGKLREWGLSPNELTAADPRVRGNSMAALEERGRRGARTPMEEALEDDQVADVEEPNAARRALGIANQVGPATARRNAETARDVAPIQQDTADIVAQRGAMRFMDPLVQRQRYYEQQNKMELATEPARIAAGSRQNVAETQADSKLAVALAQRRPSEEIIAAQLDDWTRSGVFGIDRSGRPMPPSADVQQQAHDLMMRLLGKMNGSAPAPSDVPNGQDFQEGDIREFPDKRREVFHGGRWVPTR